MKIVREYINEKFTEKGDPVQDMGIGLHERCRELIDLMEEMIRNARMNLEHLDYDEEEFTIRVDSRQLLSVESYNLPNKDWHEVGIWEPFELEYYLDFILPKNILYRSIHLSNEDMPELDYWKDKVLCNDVVGTSDEDISQMIVDDYDSIDNSNDLGDGLKEAWDIAETMLEKTTKRIR